MLWDNLFLFYLLEQGGWTRWFQKDTSNQNRVTESGDFDLQTGK